jgi:small subunit ribosomal protein S4e
MGPKKVPYLITHDARTIRYPNPHIKANDTIQVDIESGKIQEHIKFDTGTFIPSLPPQIIFLLFR